MQSAEARAKYEEAVRKERAAWAALSNASDADKSYTALEAVWKEAAKTVSKLAAEMERSGAPRSSASRGSAPD